MKITKAQKKIIMEAISETRARWEQSARNYGVMARSPDGEWGIPPDEAARKLARIEKRIRALDAAVARLDQLPGGGTNLHRGEPSGLLHRQ